MPLNHRILKVKRREQATALRVGADIIRPFQTRTKGGKSVRNRKRTGGRAENIMDSITRSLDLPQDAVSGYAHIEISGNREAIIEGCQGVLEYGDNLIALNTGKLTVRICGCGLTIISMQNGQAIIKVTITGLDYCN